ncbi:Uncharacterised protein [Mycobacteroides abscessus subsp. abscessus]|nr:Uncharacterised protein [Mycobacteroides abscessus subsp. abscessus]
MSSPVGTFRSSSEPALVRRSVQPVRMSVKASAPSSGFGRFCNCSSSRYASVSNRLSAGSFSVVWTILWRYSRAGSSSGSLRSDLG